MSYPVWRKLAADLRGAIAGCDTCVFWRHRIALCSTHKISNEEE